MNDSTLVWIANARRGRKLVFTNGVFDILHAGHVHYLQAAKSLGDVLVVGLNTDQSVRNLGKGPDRPINCLADRMAVVGALRCVDFVLSFEEGTPERLIMDLKPDVHCKGGDYVIDDLPEAEIVESYGGRVAILPFAAGHSTTDVIRRIRNPETLF